MNLCSLNNAITDDSKTKCLEPAKRRPRIRRIVDNVAQRSGLMRVSIAPHPAQRVYVAARIRLGISDDYTLPFGDLDVNPQWGGRCQSTILVQPARTPLADIAT